MALTRVPLDHDGWDWEPEFVRPLTHRGRRCVEFDESSNLVASPAGVVMDAGSIEAVVAVGHERAFHGLVWRMIGDTYESFFVRPHQVGNPDSVQYTPVFNDISAWQLYHGPGYGAAITFPIDRWFRLRVSFAGADGEAYVDDMDQPALVFGGLKVPVEGGRIGLLVGGPGLRLASFEYDDSMPDLRGVRRLSPVAQPGVVPGWWLSSPIAEDAPLAAARNWAYLPCEPSGLANIARLHPIVGERNTVIARTTVRSETAGSRALEIGFSDRAVVYLNGRPLYRGDATYRSRDYRFLGSIGYWDIVYLPLEAGDNELAIAVSESFGGWGVQARFPDVEGLTFE